MRRIAVWIAFAVVTVAALPGGTALGHSAVISADPAADSYLQLPPTHVALTFSEPVDSQASSIRLLDGQGGPVAVGVVEFTSDGHGMTVQVPTLEPGIYNVVWVNVSSVDAHGSQGSYPVTVLNSDGSVPQETNMVAGLGTGNDPSPIIEGVAVRALSLLGLAILAGAALLTLFLSPETTNPPRGLELTGYFGWVVLTIATALDLATIHATYERGLADILLHTTPGGYWLFRIGLVMLGVVGTLFVGERPRAGAAAMLGCLSLYLWALTQTSHAAAGAGSSWARAIDFAHGLAAVGWIGAVIGVAITARLLWRRAPYGRLLPRFSMLASALVFVLLATGMLSALVEFDTPSKLLETRYGMTLSVKLGLMLPLLLVGFYNMRWGRKRLVALAPGEPKRFISTAAAEVALGLAVFVAASFLTQTSVAKSVAIQPAADPLIQTNPESDLNVTLKVSPDRPGLNTFEVDLSGAPGVDLNAERVRLTFRNEDDSTIGPSTLVLSAGSSGTYSGKGPYLPTAGNWRVEAEVRRANVDDVVTSFAASPVAPPVPSTNAVGHWANPAASLNRNEFVALAMLIAGFGLVLLKGTRIIVRRGAG